MSIIKLTSSLTLCNNDVIDRCLGQHLMALQSRPLLLTTGRYYSTDNKDWRLNIGKQATQCVSS